MWYANSPRNVDGDMSNQQILEKAIQKALDGGWDITKVWDDPTYYEVEDDGIYDSRDYYVKERLSAQEIIFNHQFAISLWGKKPLNHLKQMVIAEDPIKYLGENI